MLMSSHTSPGPYPIGRLFGFQGTNALHYIWTNGYGLWTRCLKSPLIMFGQRGTKIEVCFDFFLKKTIQLLSHEMARLWGIREKNTKCAVHIWELVKSPSISYRNMQGKKATTSFKKVLILLPRHFDCETARVSASFSPLLYCDINAEKRNPCWERKRIRNSPLTSLQQLFWVQSEAEMRKESVNSAVPPPPH